MAGSLHPRPYGSGRAGESRGLLTDSSPARRPTPAVAPWATGLAATAAVAIWRPLPPADPFFSTLLILPLAVAALAGLERSTRRRQAGTGGATAAEAVALVALVLATVARHHLGLSYPARWLEAILAIGFLLLLARRLARIVVGLYPALARGGRASPSPLFFLLPLVVYLALMPWSTGRRAPNGDEPYYLLIAHSIAYDFDVDLANNYRAGDSLRFMDRTLEPQLGDPTGPDGAVYSRHNMLLPALLAPFYRLGGKLGALGLMALLAAATAWMTLALALCYYPERPAGALLAYATLGFTPPMLLYSHQVWAEVPAALLVLVALHRIRKLEEAPRSRRLWLSLALTLSLLPVLKLRFLLVAAPLLALALLRGRVGWRRLLLAGSLLAVVAAGILGFNAIAFGNPLKMHRWSSLIGPFDAPPVDFLRGALGLGFDTAFGLAGSAPIWLLLVVALPLLALRRQRLAADLLVVFLPYFLFLTPRGEWYGAWAPPFRYGLVALPCLAIALVPLFTDRRRWGARTLITALAAATIVLTLIWLALPHWTYNFALGRSHLLDHLTLALGADVSRFFPSFVRFRTASWVWPVVCLAALPLLWWLPRRRRGHALSAAVGGLLVSAGMLAALVPSLPTRVIEPEDPWVAKRGGRLQPELWTPTRVLFRSGWAMGPGDRIEAPIVRGGETLVLELSLDTAGISPEGLELVASAGRDRLASWRLAGGSGWQELRSTPLPWRPNQRLTLAVTAAGDTTGGSTLMLDRIRLIWR